MIGADIQVKGFGGIKRLFNSKDYLEALGKGVKRVSQKLDQVATDNINDRIYARTPSVSYVRTGAARSGREVEQVNSLTYRFNMTNTLSARNKSNISYTPFLNRNKRNPSLDTRFFDDAVEEVRKEQPEIMQEMINKNFNK